VPLADIAAGARDPETGLTVAEIRARTDATGLDRAAIALG
jgi:hypothetical protein